MYNRLLPGDNYSSNDRDRDVPMSQYQRLPGSSGGDGGASRALGTNAEIAEWIQQLTRKNGQLERMLAKMGTAADNADYRDNLTRLRSEGMQLCRKVMASLKSQTGFGDRQMFEKMNHQFEAQFDKYTRLAQEIERREQQIVDVMSSSSRGGPAPVDEEAGYGQHAQDQEIDIQFQRYDLEEIKRKEQGIRQIERDVQELSEMFKDLHTLVESQQEQFDVIENNIVEARDKVVSGAQELRTAEDYQKKARKKQCCLLFLVLAIVTAIVLGAVFIFKK